MSGLGELNHFTRFGNSLNLRVRKDLLGPEERAHIVEAMRVGKPRTSVGWALTFRRLPATIAKFAAEAGIRLLD